MRFAHTLMLCSVLVPCALGAQASAPRRPAPRPATGQQTPKPASAPEATPLIPGARASGTETSTSLGLKLGTLGIGGEVARLVSPHVAFRAHVNWASGSYSRSDGDGVTWRYQPDNVSFAGLLDMYPGRRGSFRFTLGAMSNPMKGTARGRIDADNIYFFTSTWTNARAVFGEFRATGSYASVLPYAGIGFGTPASSHRGVGFVMDIGAAIGKPSVSLTSTTAATTTDVRVRPALAGKEQDWREAAAGIPVYPVLSMGLMYRF